MANRSHPARLIASAALALFAAQVFASEAMAAKEKFERTKPHVNIGTIGNPASQSEQLTAGQDDPQAVMESPTDCEETPNLPDGSPRPECAPKPVR